MHPCNVVVKAGLAACVERTIKYENPGLLKVVLQAIYIPKVGGVILSTIRRYEAVTQSPLDRRHHLVGDRYRTGTE